MYVELTFPDQTGLLSADLQETLVITIMQGEEKSIVLSITDMASADFFCLLGVWKLNRYHDKQ